MLITPTLIRKKMRNTYLDLLPTELLIPICYDVNIQNGLLKHIELQYKLNKEIVNHFIQHRIFDNYTIDYMIDDNLNYLMILQEIIFENYGDTFV